MTVELDLTGLDEDRRQDRLLEEFEALAPSQSLVLRIADSPEPLLDLLQRRAAGGFDWHPLENHAAGWRIELRRRGEAPPQQRRVQDFMASDHDHIRSHADDLVQAARGGDETALRRALRRLRSSLLRHLRMEERVVFPVLSERLGHPGGPAAVLRLQHTRLRQLLDVVARPLPDAPLADRFVPAVSALVDALERHQRMEDRVLYGLTDLVLGALEREALIQACQRVGIDETDGEANARGPGSVER